MPYFKLLAKENMLAQLRPKRKKGDAKNSNNQIK